MWCLSAIRAQWVAGGTIMKRDVRTAFLLLFLFLLLVVLLLTLDVQPIGIEQSLVGLATINTAFHHCMGTHLLWYVITDWLGIAALLTACLFAAVGFFQLVKGKSFRRVDVSLLILGAFYIGVLALYLFFETCILNYRPHLIAGPMEASFPSSHTLIVLFIMASANVQMPSYVSNPTAVKILRGFSTLIIAVTILGRLYSGVHWFTDVLGGVLLGSALVLLFRATVYRGDRV